EQQTRERGGGRGEGAQDQRRRPAAAGRLDDAEGQAREEHGHEDLTDRIEPPRPWRLRLGDEAERQRDGGEQDREIDPEDRPPAHDDRNTEHHKQNHRIARSDRDPVTGMVNNNRGKHETESQRRARARRKQTRSRSLNEKNYKAIKTSTRIEKTQV